MLCGQLCLLPRVAHHVVATGAPSGEVEVHRALADDRLVRLDLRRNLQSGARVAVYAHGLTGVGRNSVLALDGSASRRVVGDQNGGVLRAGILDCQPLLEAAPRVPLCEVEVGPGWNGGGPPYLEAVMLAGSPRVEQLPGAGVVGGHRHDAAVVPVLRAGITCETGVALLGPGAADAGGLNTRDPATIARHSSRASVTGMIPLMTRSIETSLESRDGRLPPPGFLDVPHYDEIHLRILTVLSRIL